MKDPDVAIGITRYAGHLAQRPAVRYMRPGRIYHELRRLNFGRWTGRSSRSMVRPNHERHNRHQQDTRAQVKALKEAGCKRIFEESASGGRWDRPELHRALDQLREGDILVVWKLDRLSRSLKDLLHILEKIAEADAGFRSLTEHIDTATPAGRMLLQMLGAFAEFERSMVRERTRMGLQVARERGRIGGTQGEAQAESSCRNSTHGELGQ